MLSLVYIYASLPPPSRLALLDFAHSQPLLTSLTCKPLPASLDLARSLCPPLLAALILCPPLSTSLIFCPPLSTSLAASARCTSPHSQPLCPLHRASPATSPLRATLDLARSSLYAQHRGSCAQQSTEQPKHPVATSRHTAAQSSPASLSTVAGKMDRSMSGRRGSGAGSFPAEPADELQHLQRQFEQLHLPALPLQHQTQSRLQQPDAPLSPAPADVVLPDAACVSPPVPPQLADAKNLLGKQ